MLLVLIHFNEIEGVYCAVRTELLYKVDIVAVLTGYSSF
jgi:hypothetical protein